MLEGVRSIVEFARTAVGSPQRYGEALQTEDIRRQHSLFGQIALLDYEHRDTHPRSEQDHLIELDDFWFDLRKAGLTLDDLDLPSGTRHKLQTLYDARFVIPEVETAHADQPAAEPEHRPDILPRL